MVFMLYFLIEAIKPVLVPLCFVCAWGVMFLIFSSISGSVADSLRRARRMHKIPCANCVFFTGDYHLKCPVNPKIALSEEAIDCPDYRSHSGTYG
ncbi:MAG: hypothetical protein HC849_33245 [Oscillatoriales cyanobacterium RU_3_3]|nr:hypothetical protein [Microcoleus sp. SU_5_6]NJL61414.1 hypothetical protein [Candidatus Methylacidiphilales bacterium]NJM63907.1 hypothetical protein [Oscillatoriales cyanobacterium RU_3_3]NJR23808.1 hypothetical protein [Richelia sp. CSU_2_1]